MLMILFLTLPVESYWKTRWIVQWMGCISSLPFLMVVCDDGVLYNRMGIPYQFITIPSSSPNFYSAGKPPSANRGYYSFPWKPPVLFYLGWLHFTLPWLGWHPMESFLLKILTAVIGWDEFLHLLRIFGLLRWDATTKFTRPVTEIQKSTFY